MRIRLPVRRGLFFLIAFLLSALALLPLRFAADWLALGRTGVAARDAAGSVWGGAFHEAQFRELQLGDLAARLRALPLLVGRARVELGRGDGVLEPSARPDRFGGALTVSRNGYGVGGLSGRFAVGDRFAPLPIVALDLSDVDATFSAGECVAADGAVTIETSGSVAGLPIPMSMTGNARCEGGALLLPLAGASGLERLDLRVSEGDRYRATLTVRPADPALAARLLATGFVAAGGAYSLGIDGRFG